MNPSIVINAYNRPDSLTRLLKSLDNAFIPKDVRLVFSLEGGANERVIEIVENYSWGFGEKVILKKSEKLGLIGHFLFCGGLTNTYGNIVYLEDDLFVGNSFYSYALQVLREYESEEHVAGFSLNSLWFNGYTHLPFEPIADGNPCFFLQVPWYQGQVYTRKQWAGFADWLRKRKDPDHDLPLHDLFKNYTLSDDWFPIKTQYLIESRKHYCFPRASHCVNFGDQGTHFSKKTSFFQTNLAIGAGDSKYLSFEESLAVYDSYYEMEISRFKRLAPQISHYDLTVDLNGTKNPDVIKTPHVITSSGSTSMVKGFGLDMMPQELNIMHEVDGDFFKLCESKDLIKNSKAPFLRLFQYHYRVKTSRKNKLKLVLSLMRSLFSK